MMLHLDVPAGDFTLPPRGRAKVLFVTAGSGITPVMGMLRSALHELADVVVVHSAPTRDGRGLRRRAARARGATAGSGWSSGTPAPTAGSSRPSWPSWCRTWPSGETWACGPNEMLDDLEAHWADGGPGRPAAHRALPAHRDRRPATAAAP